MRYVAIAAAVPERVAARRVLRGVPDPRLPVPAGRRGRAVVGDDPDRGGPPGEPRGGQGLARRVERDDADARHAVDPRGRGAAARTGSRGVDHAGVRRVRARADDGADADHGDRAAVPRGRRRGHQRPQREGTVRRGGHGAARVQPRDHRRGAVPRPGAGRRGPRRRRGHRRGRPSPGAGADGAPDRRPDPAARRPQRPAGAADAGADGAAGARPRRDPDRVPRDDQPGLGAADGLDRDLQLRVRDPPDPDRGDRRAAGGRAAAVAVAPGGDRQRGRLPTPAGARPVDAGLRDAGHHRAGDRALAGRRPAAVRLRRRGPGRARPDRGHAGDLPRRAHRPFADRGAGARVLRPAGHGDPGRGRADRGRRQHPRGERPGRAAGPERPRGRDRDGRLARDAGARRCSCSAGCRRWASGGWAA